MIEITHLTKRYDSITAVDDVTFSVRPGVVTGFLGPNGAGKSTTMRVIVGLDAPTSGSATVNGRPYQEFDAPFHEIGALLEAGAVHTGRSAYNHLLALAQTHGLPRTRVDELIELVGLESVARKRVGGFSLGMGQRLGIAAALLGDPETIMLDEPTNGLDPDGVRWIREFLKRLAAEGRTVFLSSHLMSELSQTADHVIVIGRGRLIADIGITELLAQASANAGVIVRSPDAARLRELLAGPEVAMRSNERNVLEVHGATSAQIGDLAAEYGLVLHELIPRTASLEEAYMNLTNDSREYIAEREVERPDLEIAA